MRALRAQTLYELRQTLRNGEQLLLLIAIPVMLLVFFSVVDIFDPDTTPVLEPIDRLAPGVLALAVMSTAMTSLGIATGFERHYGVLKRLGTTPLGRGRLLGAKALTVLAVIALQAVILSGVALALGWRPSPTPGVVLAVVLGVAAFSGLGLFMAGRLRGEINLAAANGLFILLILLGDMVVPLSDLPGPVETVARLLPAAALAETVQATLTDGVQAASRAWVVLAAWAVAMPALAARTFRWH
jgi:ABC-2 type transport system permease protein